MTLQSIVLRLVGVIKMAIPQFQAFSREIEIIACFVYMVYNILKFYIYSSSS